MILNPELGKFQPCLQKNGGKILCDCPSPKIRVKKRGILRDLMQR